MKNTFILFAIFLCLEASSYTECYGGGLLHNPLLQLLKTKDSRKRLTKPKKDLPVFVGPQEGRREADKIIKLPGQPSVKFDQYSGHVTVDPYAGRALFYYFAEADNPKDKPLVLWLNGGPGCSSMGFGAMNELGPFRVNPDGETLWYNQYAWNKVANVLFLESPAGVGFSYSNRSSDYKTGDEKTAADSYTFLLNWLERFPEYKTRDFFITGESYAGHYIPQLADLILRKNKNKNTMHTVIRLEGIAIGNAYIDEEDFFTGMFGYLWTHALISDETHKGINKYCYYPSPYANETSCIDNLNTAMTEMGNINPYGIYAPLCSSAATPPGVSSTSFDPCSDNYVHAYLNRYDVQKALHVDNITGIIRPWQNCSELIHTNWTDRPLTVITVIKKLMRSGYIRVLIYSGDTDSLVSVTATKLSLPKFGAKVETPWYPWYYINEVGGYAVVYEHNLTFATVRGSGHEVPLYQPGRALALFTSFLQAKSPARGN